VGAALGAAGLPYLALQAVMGTTVFICCCSQILLGLTTSSCTWARINAHQSINQSINQSFKQSINQSIIQAINQSINQSSNHCTLPVLRTHHGSQQTITGKTI